MGGKHIGILGGTFNPIHNQHLYLAKCAYEQLALDRVILIPSGISYLKQGTNVLPSDIRYEMCMIAAKELPYVEVSDIEIKRSGNTYTRDTIQELLEADSEAVYCFIIGGDTLFMMDKWKDPEYIFKNCRIAVAARKDENDQTPEKIRQKISEYEEKYNASISILETEVSDLSSRMIRSLAAKGEDISSYVPAGVAGYIREKGLYR